jgi:hypothetical protein
MFTQRSACFALGPAFRIARHEGLETSMRHGFGRNRGQKEIGAVWRNRLAKDPES